MSRLWFWWQRRRSRVPVSLGAKPVSVSSYSQLALLKCVGFLYVNPDDLAEAMEMYPALFDAGHALVVEREVPRGRIITSSAPIYSRPIAA